jgi:hypothetical protein
MMVLKSSRKTEPKTTGSIEEGRFEITGHRVGDISGLPYVLYPKR